MSRASAVHGRPDIGCRHLDQRSSHAVDIKATAALRAPSMMGMSSVAAFLRTPWGKALIAGAWVVLFLVLDGNAGVWVAWSMVPTCVAAVALLPSRPVLGVLVMVVAALLGDLAGLPYRSVELLLPMIYAIGVLGRSRAPWPIAGLFLIAFSATAALRQGAPAFAILATVCALAPAWIFGRVVRRRAEAAAAAARESAQLASVDLEQVVENSSRTERERATSEALSVVRRAVEHMCELTMRAVRTGPPYRAEHVGAIRAEGAQAVEQLHEALMLLDRASDASSSAARARSEPAVSPPDAEPENSAAAGIGADPPSSAATVWLYHALFVCLLVASLAAPLMLGHAETTLVVLAAVIPISAWAARRFPVWAGIAAIAVHLLVAFGPDSLADWMFPAWVAYSVLIWQLRNSPRPGTKLVLTATIIATLLLGATYGSQGLGFMIVVITLPLVAAHAWREHDEILHTEQVRSARLMSGIAAAMRRAERAAQRRLAHELHDGVSHGITAMTLQAAAAQALGGRDPHHARRCMALAREIGLQTLREVDALARQRVDDGIGERSSMNALIEGARAVGLRVQLLDRRGEGGGDADRLTYRIVQEALTNITRYAPGAHVHIEVTDAGAERIVRIVDGGQARRAGTPQPLEQLGLGRGLAGIAARVAERGGRFSAGAHGAGFEVRAQWSNTCRPVETALSQASLVTSDGTKRTTGTGMSESGDEESR